MSIFLDENEVLREDEAALNRISIGGIDGILKEPLKFSVEADWEPLLSMSDRFQGTQTLLSFVSGSRMFSTGIWTKRFWKGGSYLKINPVMRILDKNGTGNVLRDSRTLLDLCLPVYKGDRSLSDRQKIEHEMNLIQEKVKEKLTLNGLVETVSDIAALGTVEGWKNAASGIYDLIEHAASNGPKPVQVKISNFFRKQFIIESVDVEFSKEMTDFGPLYADLNLTLSSQEITTKGDTGLNGPGTPKVTRKR